MFWLDALAWTRLTWLSNKRAQRCPFTPALVILLYRKVTPLFLSWEIKTVKSLRQWCNKVILSSNNEIADQYISLQTADSNVLYSMWHFRCILGGFLLFLVHYSWWSERSQERWGRDPGDDNKYYRAEIDLGFTLTLARTVAFLSGIHKHFLSQGHSKCLQGWNKTILWTAQCDMIKKIMTITL